MAGILSQAYAGSGLPGEIQGGGTRIVLSPETQYTLKAVKVDDVEFVSGGEFPTFILFNEKGEERRVAGSNDFFKAQIKDQKDGVNVIYAGDGFSAQVEYQVTSSGDATVSIKPLTEKAWKIRAVTDGGALVSVPSTGSEAIKTGFLLRPYKGGEVIFFGRDRKPASQAHPQIWDYNCTFFGVGCGKSGLIVRAPQFGAYWNAGSGPIQGVFSIYGGLTMDFRPRRDNPGPYTFWNLPLCDSQLDIQLVPVRDTTQDGVFNWVDIGVEYRQRFIRRNADLDPALPGAVIGKIQISDIYPNTLKYDQLIQEIRQINYAPQVWWMTGAHSPPGHRFEVPPHAAKPDGSHDGPDGYDYFAFKRDAAKAGAHIGIHEMFQDTSESNKNEWGKVPLRLQEFGQPLGTWETPQGWSISKALGPMVESGQFYRDLGAHFRNWDVKPGDTWHWDVFTSLGGRADFDPKHPATHGKDFRTRIAILREMKKRFGVHFTGEGLQEGVAEFCDAAYIFRYPPEPTLPNARSVPLLPVLFQGTTYYASPSPVSAAHGILMGGFFGFEYISLNFEDILQGYFGHQTTWSQICNRTVRNMVETKNGWHVEYTEGGTLDVDLAGMTRAGTFVLKVDGKTYTNDNPPPSPWGFRAELINGRYEIVESSATKK